MSEVECQIHHVIESSDENTYLECGECWHVFQTEDDLLNADAEWRGERLSNGDDVWSCPECIHDF
jgi:hypothetical protein